MTRSHAAHRIFSLAIAFMFAFLQVAYPLPTDPTIENGTADIQVNGNTMTINASDRAVINYSSFNIASHESVVITLPNTSSSILNRDLGGNMSTLAGMLQCNGLFILVNPSGIYIAPTAKIDVGSVILSTRDINTQDYINNNLVFKKISKDQLDTLLLNAGTINISKGGFGVLIAGAIENQGTIAAPIGRIHLASGDAVRLDMSADGLISVAIEEKVASAIYDHQGRPITDAIKNTGTLSGGVVVLSAGSVTGVFTKAINLEGHVNADSFTINADGTVRLVAEIDAKDTLIKAPKTELIGTDPYYFHGNATIHNLEVTTPGRQVYFEAGKKYTFKDGLRVEGADGGYNVVYLASSRKGTPWYIDIKADTYTLSKVCVGDSYNVNDALIYASPSSTSGGNVGWNLNTVYWLGGVAGGVWSNAANWSGGMPQGQAVQFDLAHDPANDPSVMDLDCTGANALQSLVMTDWTGAFTFSNNLTANAGNITMHGSAVTVAGSGDVTVRDTLNAASVNLADWGSSITLNNGANLIVQTNNGVVGLGNVGGTGHKNVTVNAGTGNVYLGSIGIGAGDQIYQVSVTGNEIHLFNDMITSNQSGNSVTLTGTVLLENSVTIDTRNSNGDIVTGTVRGVGSDKDLTLRAGGNAFVGAVGSGNEVNDVYITGNELHLYGNITTSNAVGNRVRLTGAVKLENDVTIDADTAGTDGPVTITGTVDGAHTLTLQSGTQNIGVTLAIGSGTSLTGVDFTGATIGVAAVKTSGAQAYTGTTTIGGDLTSSGGGVTVTGALKTSADTTISTGGATATVTGLVDGTAAGKSLSINAGADAIDLQSDIGTGTALSSFSLTGGAVSLGSIGTAGAAGVSGSATIAGSTSITLNGTAYNAGNLVFNASGNTVKLNNAGATTVKDTTGTAVTGALDMTAPASVSFTSGGGVGVSGTVTIGGGKTVNANASNFTVGGNWANSGTFNAGTSTVEFDGGGVSTISGNDNNFNNLKSVTAGKELDFASGTTQTVTGALTLTGAANNYVELRRSGGVDPAQWTINPSGTAGVSYVDLQNSNNAGALITAQNSLNSGNNTNWNIIGPPVPPVQGGGSGNLVDTSTFERDTSPGFSNPGSSLMTTMYSPDALRQAIITMAAVHVNIGPKEE